MNAPDLNKTNRTTEFSDTTIETTNNAIGNDHLTIIPDINRQRVVVETTDTDSVNPLNPSHLNESHLNPSADSTLSLTKPQSAIESTLHQPHLSSETTNPYQSPSANLTDDMGNTALHTQLTNDSKWHQWSGRIGRLRYLSYQITITILFYVILIVLAVVAGAVSNVSEGSPALFGQLLLFVILIIPFVIYSIGVYPKRRLHDMNQSGWLAILGFIPFVNIIFSLYLIFASGDTGTNQYGHPPRPNTTVHYIAAVVVPFVFVAIIGILAAIAIPAYQNYIERAQQAQFDSALE